MTYEEMIKRFPKQKLTDSIIEDYKFQLLSEGKITQYEITRYTNARRERERISKIILQGEEPIKKKNEDIERKKELEHKFLKLKREIEIEVRFDKIPSDVKKDKIRQYVETCFVIYKKEKISKMELQFLGRALEKIPINYKDIVRYAKMCFRIDEYEQALKMIRNIEIMEKVSISEDEKESLKQVENTLSRFCKIREAINIMKKGNSYEEVISAKTGLSIEEIKFLKYKLYRKSDRFLDIQTRDKIIKIILVNKKPPIDKIRQKYGITDLEMEDIESQIKFEKELIGKKDGQVQIKKDSCIRIVALYTKIGKNINEIADILEIDNEDVQKNIELALQAGIITQDQLHGVNNLKPQKISFDKIER